MPMRPYTAAVGAAASRRARSRMRSASMPVTGATASGVNGDDGGGDRRRAPATCSPTVPRSTRPSANEHVRDGGEQVGVGAGPDRPPTRRRLGGPAPPRVDDDDLAAALEDRLDAAGPVGRRGQAAVRRARVGAEHQEEVGAVEVGHRHGEATEHEPGRRPPSAAGRPCSPRRRWWCRAPSAPARRRAARRGCGRSGCPGRRRRRRARAVRRRRGGRRRPPPTPPPRSTSTSSPSAPRTSGRRSRSGSSCSCFSVEPFGTDVAVAEDVVAVAADPRHLLAAVRRPCRSVISSPHPASQSGQVRNAVRVEPFVVGAAAPVVAAVPRPPVILRCCHGAPAAARSFCGRRSGRRLRRCRSSAAAGSPLGARQHGGQRRRRHGDRRAGR